MSGDIRRVYNWIPRHGDHNYTHDAIRNTQEDWFIPALTEYGASVRSIYLESFCWIRAVKFLLLWSQGK